LRSLYEQWRLLTEQEGTAIRAADWTRVGECQSEKKRLQPHIQKADEDLEEELRTRGATRKALEKEFRAVVQELIRREGENDRELAAQRGIAEEKRQELHQASRQLRQVHQAYAPGKPALWHSYS
jgi:plasmid stability protein